MTNKISGSSIRYALFFIISQHLLNQENIFYIYSLLFLNHFIIIDLVYNSVHTPFEQLGRKLFFSSK